MSFKLTLTISNAANQLLEKLSRETNKEMADVLRLGVGLLGIKLEEEGKGNNLAIVRDGKIIKIIE